MSAGVKPNIKQEIKDLVAVSDNFFWRSTLKNWEIQFKKMLYFSFVDFGWYSIHLDIVR